MGAAATAARRVGLWLIALLCTDLTAGVAGATPMGSDAQAEPPTLREAADAAGRFFGAATGPAPGDAAHARALTTHFNSLTPENELKWTPLSPAPGVYDFTRADATLAFAEEQALRVRGHTLFWARLNGLPGWLEGEVAAAPDPPARLRELMAEHTQAVMGRYTGRIESWDVVNEPLALGRGALDSGNLFFRTLGAGWVGEALTLARAADPAALLFVNEIFAAQSEASFQGLYSLVSDLVASGAPIDGVGLQGHYTLLAPDRVELERRLQAFADLGVAVELTEVDISIALFEDASDPLAAQAGAYRDLLEACLAVASCRGVTVWGVDDGHSWLDGFFPLPEPHRPLLLDESYMPKPAYEAVRDSLLAHAVPEPGAAPLLLLSLASACAAGSRRPR